jgi:ubiquinone biosynthesis protein UbiJ
MNKLDENIRKFIYSEGKFAEPSLKSYIQSLDEILAKMEARTMTEARRLEIAREQVKGIKRQTRRLEEKLFLAENEKKQLQEQLKILEEQNKKEVENG